jgi:hypothetical protein
VRLLEDELLFGREIDHRRVVLRAGEMILHVVDRRDRHRRRRRILRRAFERGVDAVERARDGHVVLEVVQHAAGLGELADDVRITPYAGGKQSRACFVALDRSAWFLRE